MRRALLVLAFVPVIAGAQTFDEMARRFPPEFAAETEEALIRRVAKGAGLEVKTKVLPGQGSPLAVHRVEVSGRGTLEAIAFFFSLIGIRDYRAADLEALTLDRDGGAMVFNARIALPTYQWEESRDERTLIPQMKRFEWKRLDAVTELLKSMPQNPAIHITAGRVGEETTLRGAVVGAGPRSELRTWLEKSGFGKSTVAIADRGVCRPFSITAVQGDEDDTISMPSRDRKTFADTALCESKPWPDLGRAVARGKGDLHLRLRDADLSTVALALHDVSEENFVVDSDIEGIIDVEVEAASVHDVIAALRSSGLRVSDPPMRRISRAGSQRAPTPPGTFAGENVSFALQDASLSDVLCAFSDLTKLEIIVPAGLNAKTALFVRDLPWDQVIHEVIYSGGFTYSIDGTRVYVGDSKGDRGANACKVDSTNDPLSAVRVPLDAVSPSDLELIGYSKKGEALRAYARLPGRRIATLEPGARLFDARVRSLSSTGVTFEEERRTFEIPFDNTVPAWAGAWKCISGPCIDPEIEIDVQEGVRVFHSWIHNRPSSSGTWSLEGSTIWIECCAGSRRGFEIVRSTPKELVLREEDDEEPARYRRIE